MSDEAPSGRRSELSPEAQALDQRARDLVSDLTDLDLAPSAGGARHGGDPLFGEDLPPERDPLDGADANPYRVDRGFGERLRTAFYRIRRLVEFVVEEWISRVHPWVVTAVAFLLLILLLVVLIPGDGDGDGDGAAAPTTPADADAAVVDDPADAAAPDEAAADPDVATPAAPAADECLLSGVLEVSSVMTGTEQGEMEPVFGGLAYTAYRGQATITNTSDQAIRVRTLHLSFSDQAGTWSGGHRLEAGGSVVEDVNGSVYEDGRSVYDVLASVAAIVDSPDCLREFGNADYAEFQDVAVAIPNPLPVGP